MHRHSLTYRGAVLNLKRYRLRPASSCPDIISVATSVDGRDSFVSFLNFHIHDFHVYIMHLLFSRNIFR